jgi:hypothetical protein
MSTSQKTDEDFDKLLFPDTDEVIPPGSDSPEPTGRHFAPAMQDTTLPSTKWPGLRIISRRKK